MQKIFIFLLSAAACFFFSACSGKQEKASVLLNRAVDAAQKADWDAASALADKALRQNPGSVDIQIFHVLTQEKIGRPEEALNKLQALASEHPENYMVQYTLGRLLYRKGKYEQSIPPLKTAMTARPDDPNVLLLLAKAESRLNTKEAFAIYQKLLTFPEFKGNSMICNEMAVLCALRNNPARAVNMLQFACKDLPVAILNEAVIYDFHMDDRQKALNAYERFLRMTASRPEQENRRLKVSRRIQEIK